MNPNISVGYKKQNLEKVGSYEVIERPYTAKMINRDTQHIENKVIVQKYISPHGDVIKLNYHVFT
jgi:hypothetical protein